LDLFETFLRERKDAAALSFHRMRAKEMQEASPTPNKM
jgi:hypothetical protein